MASPSTHAHRWQPQPANVANPPGRLRPCLESGQVRAALRALRAGLRRDARPPRAPAPIIPGPAFREVAVLPDPGQPIRSGLALALPGGLRVEGLTVREAATLVGLLR